MFQALELNDQGFIDSLLSSLAKHLKITKIPRIDKESMRQELLMTFSGIQDKQTKSGNQLPQTPATDELPDTALEILTTLGKYTDEYPLAASDLSNALHTNEQRIQYFLDLLDEKELVHRFWNIGSPSAYILTKEGRKLLFLKNLL